MTAAAAKCAVLAAAIALASPAIAQTAQSTTSFAEMPATPGSWAYRPLANASEAFFIDTTATVRLVVHCTRASRRITISRTSAAPAPSLLLWSSFGQRIVPARFEQNAMRVSVDLAATDSLLDAMAFSRGRVAIAMPGSPPLIVTPGTEAARVFEDCRI